MEYIVFDVFRIRNGTKCIRHKIENLENYLQSYKYQ